MVPVSGDPGAAEGEGPAVGDEPPVFAPAGGGREAEVSFVEVSLESAAPAKKIVVARAGARGDRERTRERGEADDGRERAIVSGSSSPHSPGRRPASA